MNAGVLQVAELHPSCRVLGPGDRFVLWVQGCGIGCRECVSPQWIPFEGGRSVPVDDLAARIVREAVDGLTISGGEPFAQAAGLARLVRTVRERRDLSVLSYSGYVVEHLRARGTPAQRDLLSLLDILIDGPYLANRQASLRWRGSANQRINLLTDRHEAQRHASDTSAGLQIEVGPDDSVRWLGVPVVRGFRELFEERVGLTPAARAQEGEE